MDQGCGSIEPTTRHFNLFSPLSSCSPYTCILYTVQFQFTRHSLDLADNVLHDWLFKIISCFCLPSQEIVALIKTCLLVKLSRCVCVFHYMYIHINIYTVHVHVRVHIHVVQRYTSTCTLYMYLYIFACTFT